MTRRQEGDRRSVTARSLSALAVFDEKHRALTLSQISRRADLPLPTTHRLVADLTEARLLRRRPDGAYEIGARLWHLGLLSAPTTLRETALPHLQDLVAATGHTVHLAVLEGTGALVVERLAGTRTVSTRHRPGAVLPLHCTAVGKALLAHADADVQDEVLRSLVPFTPYTVTNPKVISRQLATVRRDGVARSAQEHRLGVSSLALPIFGSTGLVAALAVLAPLTTPRLSASLVHLRDAAAAIAEGLRRQSVEDEAV